MEVTYHKMPVEDYGDSALAGMKGPTKGVCFGCKHEFEDKDCDRCENCPNRLAANGFRCAKKEVVKSMAAPSGAASRKIWTTDSPERLELVERIRSMRNEGVSYRAIGKALRIGADTVGKIARAEGMVFAKKDKCKAMHAKVREMILAGETDLEKIRLATGASPYIVHQENKGLGFPKGRLTNWYAGAAVGKE